MNVIAQIGCGYWGPNLLRNFSSQPNCWVKWVVDTSPQRQAYVEQHYPKTQVTPNWEDAISDPEVDAVIVATPASTHYEFAKIALNAGKHVLVEKPLAMSTEEADELIALAAAAGKILMVGHTFLYNTAVRYLKELLDRGDPGKLYYIYCQRLNLGQVRTDVNAWWNLAPHDLSILLYLMNDELPISVTARGVDYIQPGIEDVVFATLTWANRVTANIQVG
jgi:predicted dehydrogenase